MMTKKDDTYWIESELGEHITHFCSRLSRLALQTRNKVAGKFNGVTLTATIDTTTENLEKEFHKQLRIDAENYKKTPEYAQAQAEQKHKLEQNNAKAQSLMQSFTALNWNSYAAILQWLSDIQPVADYTGVTLDRSYIISEFIRRGFGINVNTGKDFQEKDADNVARYIIGQALDGFQQVGAPHGILISFVDKWRKQFKDATPVTDAVIIPGGLLC